MGDRAGSSVAQALRQATQQLVQTSDTARLDAELLMAHALGVSRSELLLRHMQDEASPEFAALVDRRAAHEPIAHIIGQQEFFGLAFKVTRDTLIPRGDSEVLVEAALALCAGEEGRALDLGTGTGALLLAFLANRPGWSGMGIDASPAALSVASENARRLELGTRATILAGDWTQSGWADGLGRFDLVLCNPPYVETGADLPRSVACFEPSAALFAGPEGLDDYRLLIPRLDKILSAAGKAIFEIGHKQADAVAGLATSHGFSSVIRHDLGGRARAVILTRGVGKGFANV